MREEIRESVVRPDLQIVNVAHMHRIPCDLLIELGERIQREFIRLRLNFRRIGLENAGKDNDQKKETRRQGTVS